MNKLNYQCIGHFAMRYFPWVSSRHFQIFPRRLVEQKSEGFVMPLLGKKPYSFASPPDDIQQNDEVFVIKETNEVFKSYKYPLQAQTS